MPCASSAKKIRTSTHRRRPHCRSDARGGKPDRRPRDRAQRRARPPRAARRHPRALYRFRYRHDVDARGCAGARQPAFRVGQEVSVVVSAFPDRVFTGTITTIGASVDPNTAACWSAPRSKTRTMNCGRHVRELHHSRRRPDELAGHPAGRCGPGGRWHHVRVGDRRPAPVRQTHVRIGEQNDGYRQILEGVQAGELVATEGAYSSAMRSRPRSEGVCTTAAGNVGVG